VPLSLDNPQEVLIQGVRACRDGDWRGGLTLLTLLAQREERRGSLPAFFYGYLGQAIARCEGRKHVGLELCRYAVEENPFYPDNHCNLAAVYLIAGNRWAAIRALRAGLALDPEHRGLVELQKNLKVRRQPPLAFLSRSNPLNVWIGRLTWRAYRRREEKRRQQLEDEELELLG
jgi:tetratricopeptide (TPR) repeat protein